MMEKNLPLKISLNINETLEAKELFRQCYLADGTVQHLVRWRICGAEKQSSSREIASSSASLSEESKTTKDVFLWMTNCELMTSCPHLYSNDMTAEVAPHLKTDDEKDKKEQEDASSDMEDLDDMKHDVVKLVCRARKQMQRLKNENVPKRLASLSHTTKVLSTYAGLGSLAGVFRETGALDLILELLWTNDVETRRAAGRMLRALALHDAGSRAYVLLSLTQDKFDKQGDNNISHYADFENRSMVMEMFAETASGEEAHAVALDSVQLPQVPGKVLFTLMKCYLRVTSLMDVNNGKDGILNKQQCSWMWLNDQQSDESFVEDFEVAMAISDLIYELNQVMEWKGTSMKSAKITSSDNNASLLKNELSRQGGTTSNSSEKTLESERKAKETEVTSVAGSKVVTKLSKPLFVRSSHENTVDPSLLASLLRSDQRSSTYKHPSSFSSRKQYTQYIRSMIKPGFRVRACQSYQDVHEGDEGIYRQHNESTPPVQVFWHRLNRPYWVHWHHIQLISSSPVGSPIAKFNPSKISTNPEESTLWPLLSGMQTRAKTIYGIKALDMDHNSDGTQTDVSLQEWWLILFHVNKLSKVKKDVIKQYLQEMHGAHKHMCQVPVTKDDAFFIMAELLKEASVRIKSSMCVSPICRNLIDTIEETERKEREEIEKKQAEIKDNKEPEKEIETEQELKNRDDEKCGSCVSEKPSTSRSPEESKSEKDEVTEEEVTVSPEVRSKAVEMGLRIGLMFDELSEKKYLKMFLNNENYLLAEKLWHMQKESEGVIEIAKSITKANCEGKEIALAILHIALSRSNWSTPESRNDMRDILGYVLVAADDDNRSVIKAYLGMVSACLSSGGPKTDLLDEPDSVELTFATTGHLKAILDIFVRFQADENIIYIAIQCISKIMGAGLFAKSSYVEKDRSIFSSVMSAIITSIMTATGLGQSSSTDTSSTAPSNQILPSILTAMEKLIKNFTPSEDKGASSSFTDLDKRMEMVTLHHMLCVLCVISRKDQSKSLMKISSQVLTVLNIGLQSGKFSPTSDVRRMMQRLKGITMSSKNDTADFDLATDNNGDENIAPDGDFGPFISNDARKTNSEEIFSEYIEKIKSDSSDEVRSSAIALITEVVFPIIKRATILSREHASCLSNLKNFLSEFKTIAQDTELILFEQCWSDLVSYVYHVSELCLSSTDKSLSLEVATHAVAILRSLAELDRDFAVELCGMEAKRTINRLLEKHDTIPNASELKDIVTSCERHGALHCKLLAVVLGGCVSTALRCIESARRLQRPLNVPLFDQLLINLCNGADAEINEDKCWDRMEVSSNQRHLSKLTDNNPKTYWESNGSSGAHWINVYMKKGVVVRKMMVLVAQEDSSYMPSRIVVLGGSSPSDVGTQLSCVNVSASDREVIILENARRYWPLIRISIRRCQQGGIDTRIHGLDIFGPKPSFWPILRRQLYVRTSLIYAVQAHNWASDARKVSISDDDDVSMMKHVILDMPNKLVQAINYEQRFADRFLPNPESALVLGQACRSALSGPVLATLLEKGGTENMEKSLLEKLLLVYLKLNERSESAVNVRIFSSKLRRLLRLIVDLDEGGNTSSLSDARTSSGKGHQENISLWSKKVQPLSSAKSGGTETKTSSRAESAETSAVRANLFKTSSSDDVASTTPLTDDELYECTTNLPRLAEQWVKLVRSKFHEAMTDRIAACDVTQGSAQCFSIANIIVEEYSYLQKCTKTLFGSKTQFTLMFSVGVWKAFTLLSLKESVKFCYACIFMIHFYVTAELSWQETRKVQTTKITVKRLLDLLSVISGTDVCYTFEHMYVTMLSKRLQASKVSLELEEEVCRKLRSCFPNQRPIAMLQDYVYSEKLHDQFTSLYLEKYDAVVASNSLHFVESHDSLWQEYTFLCEGGFKVSLVRPVVWCHYNSYLVQGRIEKCMSQLDERCARFLSQYESFFRAVRISNSSCLFLNGKSSLQWTASGYAVLHDLVNDVDLTVSTAQLLFLLQFNHQDEVDLRKWKEFFPWHEERMLLPLISKNVICKIDDDTFKLSDSIDHDIDLVNRNDEILNSLQWCSEAMEHHSTRRRNRIDLIVIRILKKAQEMSGDILIERVIEECSRHQYPVTMSDDDNCSNLYFHFVPLANEIRSRCDDLVDRGYITRQISRPQMLMYNPGDDHQNKTGDNTDATNSVDPSIGDETKRNESETAPGHVKSSLENAVVSTESSLISVHVNLPSSTKQSSNCEPIMTSFCTKTPLATDSIQLDLQNSEKELKHAVKVDRDETPIDFPTIDMTGTTVTSEKLGLEIREKVAALSEILSQTIDVAEALLLEFEWNMDKLIEAFYISKDSVLQTIGIAPVDDQNALAASSDVGNSSMMPDEDEQCPICLNSLGANPIIPACRHKSCVSCWQTYLRLKLDQDKGCITTCPHNSCLFRPTTRMYEEVFPNDQTVQEKYRVSLVRSFVECNRSYSWCHNPKGCDRIIRKAQDGRQEGWCYECGWQTCFSCTYVEAHDPASCSHMSQWVDDGGYYEGMSEDAQSKHLTRLIAKRCPSCQANIEKNDGCLHMKCAKCSHDFCWRCLQPWRPTHRDYYNCSSKVSKLAQEGMKFVEYNKRCQFHNRAKQFAYDVRNRILSVDSSSVRMQHLKFSLNMCMKLVQCRKVLAYSNVFSFYSTHSDKMRNIELHSAALENQTLQLQEHLSLALLSCADIQHMLSSMSEEIVTEGRRIMLDCDTQLKNFIEFSRHGMKICSPSGHAQSTITHSDAASAQVDSNFQDLAAANSRPAGMSDDDDDDDDDDHDDDANIDDDDNDTSEHTQSDNDDDDSDVSNENVINVLYSSDSEDDNAPSTYDSDNALSGMDVYTFDNQNYSMDSDSDDMWFTF